MEANAQLKKKKTWKGSTLNNKRSQHLQYKFFVHLLKTRKRKQNFCFLLWELLPPAYNRLK